MKVLSYAPSVEVYVACSRNGSVKYYDLSEDVTSCTVNRITDGASSFSVHLLNPGGKYTDMFEPFDRVVIFANKGATRSRLITGYITSAPRYRLFEQDLQIDGYDDIYRLQQLYFDPGLVTSQMAQGIGMRGWDHATAIASLLINVGGWNPDMIGVKQEIPKKVSEWAYDMYMAQREDVEGLDAIARDFQNVLMTSGPVINSATGTGGGSMSVDNSQLGAGQTIEIPEPYGNGGFTITMYHRNGWQYADGHTATVAAGTGQRRVHDAWVAEGCNFDDGIAVLKGRYLIACTPKFGTCGDYITFTLSDGTEINGIMADEKGADAGNPWGHNGGRNVVEFEVSIDYYRRYGNPGSGGWKNEWGGKRVVRGTNYGPAL